MSVYTVPEVYGLLWLGDVEWPKPVDCEYDVTAVWRDHDGRLYVGDTCGCRGELPFDDIDRSALRETDPVSLLEHLRERAHLAVTFADSRYEARWLARNIAALMTAVTP